MKTCGVMYLDALTKHTGGDVRLIRAFAAGFVNGQSEKVYLGACKAAMFRPSADRRELILELVSDACARYGLSWYDAGSEVWVCRADNWVSIHEAYQMSENTPIWHLLRARLCGIPESEIDVNFHKRRGAGEPCDIVESA